jgi:hypothetical protein
MTDTPESTAAKTPPQGLTDEAPGGTATPEELLAETQPDDPEVGIDGTGMGELP